MGSKNTRKTFKIGQSRAITLPKSWLDYHGKEATEELTLLGDAILIIAPKGLEAKAKRAIEILENKE
jgi:antitoxin component of MazEF toxin-antitoxin module